MMVNFFNGCTDWFIETNSKDIYSYTEIALRILLTIPVTIASYEKNFSKLKLLEKNLRSTIEQEKLTRMAILYTEHEFDSTILYEQFVDGFVSLKAQGKHNLTTFSLHCNN